MDEKSLNLVIKFEQRKNQTIKCDRTYKYQFEKYKVCSFGDDCLPSFAAFSMDQVPMSTLNSGTILSARRPCNTFPLLSPHTASTYAASSLRSNRAQRANYQNVRNKVMYLAIRNFSASKLYYIYQEYITLNWDLFSPKHLVIFTNLR